MSKYIDITGQKFGRLTVLERAESRRGNTYWRCLCDCGRVLITEGLRMRKGHTRSCGCLQREEMAARTRARQTVHGLSHTRLYNIWSGIIHRCIDPKTADYKDYGARGITVCDEWRDDFEAFYDWSMANGYTDKLTIDRVDVDGNYCPENCRWATAKEQANNRRSNKFLTYKGETRTQQEWADIVGIHQSTIKKRLDKGWTVERALEAPTRIHRTPEK